MAALMELSCLRLGVVAVTPVVVLSGGVVVVVADDASVTGSGGVVVVLTGCEVVIATSGS